MKTNYLLTVLLAMFLLNINAQIINVNPDPYGDPWIVGGVPEITPEIQAELDAIPEMVLSPFSLTYELPDSVDNSKNMFMRPIFLQSGNSCAQAAGVGYTFTYETNWARNLSSNISENQYPTHYTWNFLNSGNGSGSYHYHGWKIIMENGCPNVPTWGGMSGNSTRWMTGYENYLEGMYNRIEKYEHIDVNNPNGLEDLKHWISHHNSDEEVEVGGLGVFLMVHNRNLCPILTK